MGYSEDDYLLLSGIQHFAFCKRQWGLIHIEQQWAENLRTVEGDIFHEKAHGDHFIEKRKNVIVRRGMRISSTTLGITGQCDIVEFVRNDKTGTAVFGYDGRYDIIPIEYKVGKAKEGEEDITQLVAQAMCLEDMFCCEIPKGFIFYGETRRRWEVNITEERKNEVRALLLEMHRFFSRNHTPVVRKSKKCSACSLKELCIPTLVNQGSALKYIEEMIIEDGT